MVMGGPTRKQIVICDDHPVFRRGLAAALTEEEDLALAGQAGSLSELQELLGSLEGSVDLVLLDVELPEGSAIAGVAELASQARVVMLSAYDDPQLVHDALSAGAVGYIRKDEEPPSVLRLIRRAMEGRTALTGDMALRLADSLRGRQEPTALAQVVAELPPRQRDVLELVAEGCSNREIAGRLHLSEGTVKNHVSNLLDATGMPDRTKLAVAYVQHCLNRRSGGAGAGFGLSPR